MVQKHIEIASLKVWIRGEQAAEVGAEGNNEWELKSTETE